MLGLPKSKDPNGKEYGIARLQSAAMGIGSMFAAGNLAARIKQTGDENLELIRMSELRLILMLSRRW
jgi:hypothetical protein